MPPVVRHTKLYGLYNILYTKLYMIPNKIPNVILFIITHATLCTIDYHWQRRLLPRLRVEHNHRHLHSVRKIVNDSSANGFPDELPPALLRRRGRGGKDTLVTFAKEWRRGRNEREARWRLLRKMEKGNCALVHFTKEWGWGRSGKEGHERLLRKIEEKNCALEDITKEWREKRKNRKGHFKQLRKMKRKEKWGIMGKKRKVSYFGKEK